MHQKAGDAPGTSAATTCFWRSISA